MAHTNVVASEFIHKYTNYFIEVYKPIKIYEMFAFYLNLLLFQLLQHPAMLKIKLNHIQSNHKKKENKRSHSNPGVGFHWGC